MQTEYPTIFKKLIDLSHLTTAEDFMVRIQQ